MNGAQSLQKSKMSVVLIETGTMRCKVSGPESLLPVRHPSDLSDSPIGLASILLTQGRQVQRESHRSALPPCANDPLKPVVLENT